MIPLGLLQEYGFQSEEKFPRQLRDDAVTLSLPSAVENGVEPVIVEIRHGLMIPLTASGANNGMIINDDGLVLHVGHRDPQDKSSPLEARFIKDIPYDIRVEINQIMRRAILVAPALNEIWQMIVGIWEVWFPLNPHELKGIRLGSFTDARQAWEAVLREIGQVAEKPGPSWVRVFLQHEREFNRGWMGEEILVDEGLARKMACFTLMQRALRDPVFHPKSTFRLVRERRSVDVIKLVVVPPWGDAFIKTEAAGIEL